MLKKILLGLAGVLAVLVVVIATRPSHFRIERTVTMAAPPAVPYALVNDFHAWTQWSPWDKMDPAMKREYLGPATGLGSGYHWSSETHVGEGRMTITAAKPAEAIGIRLEFVKPFATTNTTTFTFAPDGAGTKVTWAMEGENNFVGKAVCMIMNMDETVGGDFLKGLTAMKVAAEGQATAPTAAKVSSASH